MEVWLLGLLPHHFVLPTVPVTFFSPCVLAVFTILLIHIFDILGLIISNYSMLPDFYCISQSARSPAYLEVITYYWCDHSYDSRLLGCHQLCSSDVSKALNSLKTVGIQQLIISDLNCRGCSCQHLRCPITVLWDTGNQFPALILPSTRTMSVIQTDCQWSLWTYNDFKHIVFHEICYSFRCS